jgi:hypothetical protein
MTFVHRPFPPNYVHKWFRPPRQSAQHIHISSTECQPKGGKALETSHNYAGNVRISKEITQGLGFEKVENFLKGKLPHFVENQVELRSLLIWLFKGL